WLIAGGRSLLYDPITDPRLRRPERELFPGMMLLALTLCALFMWDGFSTRPRPQSGRPSGGGRVKNPSHILRILDVAIVFLAIGAYFASVTDRVRFAWHGRTLLAYRGTTGLAWTLA